MRHRAAAVASLSLVLLAPLAAGAQPATTPAAAPPPTYWTESPSATIPADIQRLARQYLVPGRQWSVAVLPKGMTLADAAALDKAAAQGGR